MKGPDQLPGSDFGGAERCLGGLRRTFVTNFGGSWRPISNHLPGRTWRKPAGHGRRAAPQLYFHFTGMGIPGVAEWIFYDEDTLNLVVGPNVIIRQQSKGQKSLDDFLQVVSRRGRGGGNSRR